MTLYNLYGRSVGAGGARGARVARGVRGARGSRGAGGLLYVLKHFFMILYNQGQKRHNVFQPKGYIFLGFHPLTFHTPLHFNGFCFILSLQLCIISWTIG